MKIPITDQVAAVEREIKYRARVYPRLVESGRMTPTAADHQMAVMGAVLETLQELARKERLI